MMQTVELAPGEWQQVLALIALGPWRDANPLLMKIGSQLQKQSFPSMTADGNGLREVER